jgi:hypothetical protein
MPTDANERLHAEVENGTLERLIDPAIPFDIAECRRRKAQVVALLERMAKLLVTREAARAGADSPWASVRVFGSSAIGADVVSSDLDLYVRSFRYVTGFPPSPPRSLSLCLSWCLSAPLFRSHQKLFLPFRRSVLGSPCRRVARFPLLL